MRLNVVWLGDLGFPYGLSGVVQKTLLCCKGLTENGVGVTVINGFGIHTRSADSDLKGEGVFENIKYIHVSGSPYRHSNFFVRNFRKYFMRIREIYILYKLRKNGKLDAAIIRTDNFLTILYYRIMSKLLGFPLIMLYVELYSSINVRQGLKYKISDYLYEKYGFYLLDGIMPISDFLIDVARKHSPSLPSLKVPMITDFDRFDGVERNSTEKYFMYCGAAGYFEIIIFILQAFELLQNLKDTRLYLVISGRQEHMKMVNKEIAKNKNSSSIKLYSGVSYAKLNYLYANALGLLIPIRPTVQDTARFPHKLGEYLGSGSPVVTTNCSEVAKYFKDEEAALIAQNYDIREFAQKMEYILVNPEKAKKIGQTGRSVGLDNFDYKTYGPKMKEFINSIIVQNMNS